MGLEENQSEEASSEMVVLKTVTRSRDTHEPIGSLEMLRENGTETERDGSELVFYNWYRIRHIKFDGKISVSDIKSLIKKLNLEISLRGKLKDSYDLMPFSQPVSIATNIEIDCGNDPILMPRFRTADPLGMQVFVPEWLPNVGGFVVEDANYDSTKRTIYMRVIRQT